MTQRLRCRLTIWLQMKDGRFIWSVYIWCVCRIGLALRQNLCKFPRRTLFLFFRYHKSSLLPNNLSQSWGLEKDKSPPTLRLLCLLRGEMLITWLHCTLNRWETNIWQGDIWKSGRCVRCQKGRESTHTRMRRLLPVNINLNGYP